MRKQIPPRDTYRAFTVAGMVLVSIVAAVLSFVHIESLALRYGQPAMVGALLPLSIDGTIVVCSMSMLRAARSGLTTPFLARAMLALAIGATLACNVSYGLPHGIPGALLSGWPAIAFTGCAELSIGMSRRKPVKAPVADAATRPDSRSVNDSTDQAKSVRAGSVNANVRAGKLATQEQTALSALIASPDMSYAELAAQLGTSERTARRVRARIDNRLPAMNGNMT